LKENESMAYLNDEKTPPETSKLDPLSEEILQSQTKAKPTHE
jgi:hypothetical protein